MSKKNRATDRSARAAALEEQQREERRRRTRMIGGVVLVLVVVVALILVLQSVLGGGVEEDEVPATGSEFGLTIGPDDAPHTVVIYEDFLCPYCGELERATREDLARLADDGDVQVEYRPFDLLGGISDYSPRAAGAFAIVLEESGLEVAKEFHDLLFENQPSESGPFPSDADLIDLAVEAGADEAEVRDAIENGAGQQWVDDATQAAKDAGVQGTPTVLLDGEVFQDGRTVDDLADNLVDRLS